MSTSKQDTGKQDIVGLRVEIDALDDQLLDLLNRRAALARRVGELKGGAPAYRPEREAEILRRIVETNPGPLPAERAVGVFREVISACRGMEQQIRVAYLGPTGTFSETAALRQFGGAAQYVPCASFDDIFRAVETRSTEFAVVPVENSTEGVIARTLDLLLTSPARICGEVVLRVEQNLMRKVAGVEGVTRVYSHAQSLAQCHDWLSRHLPNVERVPVSSNAEAARLAAQEPAACAVGPALAAQRYGLQIISANIEDDANNRTRFLVLGDVECAPTGRDSTSLVMSAPNKPGAVHALLTPIARHGISMSRLESRPARAGSWEYFFFVDLVGHQRDPGLAEALAELRSLAPFLKILGSYPVAVA
jgi:chorismate mutase/prephenate dehydratase